MLNLVARIMPALLISVMLVINEGPSGSVQCYKDATGWITYKDIIVSQ